MKKFLLVFLSLVTIMAVGTACKDTGGDSSGSNSASQTEVSETLKTMNVSLPSKSFPYDGNAHSLAIEGLPENAVVEWQNNSLTDVGTQTVCATVKCKGYKDASLKGELTVVGQDIAAGVALAETEISVAYGGEYAFALSDASLLPEGATLTEKYVDKQTGAAYTSKPTKGGEFKYLLMIEAVGYNVKVLEGALSIERPAPVSIEITNMPTLADANYWGKSAILPGSKWVPKVKILPEGHTDVVVEYSSANESRMQYQNGAFLSSTDVGSCEITVSIKDTEISQTYTVYIANTSFVREDFEDAGKEVFVQEYVMEKNEDGIMAYKVFTDEYGNGYPAPIPRGKTVRYDENDKVIVKTVERKVEKDGQIQTVEVVVPVFYDKEEPETYYGANSSLTTEIQTINGNNVLHVTNVENYDAYYSYMDIDVTPSGGWEAGRYHVEMDVSGDYDFIFYWAYGEYNAEEEKITETAVFLPTGVIGRLTDGKADVQNGKIVLEFTLTAEQIGTYKNAIRLCQFDRRAVDFTIDNICLMKIG